MRHVATFTVEVDSGDHVLSLEDALTLARAHLRQQGYSVEVVLEQEVLGRYAFKPEGHEGEWDTHPDRYTAQTTEVRVDCEVVRELEISR